MIMKKKEMKNNIMENKVMDLYISVRGGLGKNLSFTGVAKWLKDNNKFEHIYVHSPYFDVFECCPAVDGIYKPNEIRDFIFDAKHDNARLVIDNMYQTEEFIYKTINYKDAWLKMLGIEDSIDEVKVCVEPLTAYPALQNFVDQVKKDIKDKGYKDFAIMQFTGGQSPLVQVPNNDWTKVPYDYQNEPLKRHYPIEKAQAFVELYHKANPETAVILYQLPNEPKPQGEFIFNYVIPYLTYNLLAREAKEIVTIDSSLQHLTAGLCKTTVIWGHSLPESFGYEYNNNIIQECRRDDLCYFTELGPSGARVKYITPEELVNVL